MSAKGLKNVFSVDDIIHSELDEETGTAVHQTGNAFGGETEGSSDCEDWSCPVGFASLPSPPTGEGDEKEAAQAFKKNESDYDAILGKRDLRMNWAAGKLKPGETCVYAGGLDCKAQARSHYKQDGSISHTTTVGNAENGKTIGIFIQPSGFVDVISDGTAAFIRPGEISLFNTESSMTIASDVKILAGGVVNISGGSITLGGQSAKPTMNAEDLDWIITQLIALGKAIGATTPTTAGVNPFVAGLKRDIESRKTRNE